MKMTAFLLTLLVISGCAAKKKKTEVADRIFDIFEKYSKSIVTDNEIKRNASERPELPQSYKLAVYFKAPEEKSKGKQDWKWTQENKEKILSTLRTQKGKVGKVFEMLNLGDKEEDAKSLRLMAAQQGADALLILQGISEVDTDANPLAVTYLAVLPAFFVEGNNVEGTFLTQAVLWNVESPFIHLAVQSEGEYSHERPLAFRQTSRVIKKSKEESLEGISEKIAREIQEI